MRDLPVWNQLSNQATSHHVQRLNDFALSPEEGVMLKWRDFEKFKSGRQGIATNLDDSESKFESHIVHGRPPITYLKNVRCK